VENDLGFLILFIGSLAEFKSISKGWDPVGETLANPSTWHQGWLVALGCLI
jgi:hypothetical protein